MKLNVIQGNILENAADTLIVNLFEGVTAPAGATGALNRILNGAVSELIVNGDLRGKLGEVAVIYPHGTIPAKRVLIVGLGMQDELSLEKVRGASASAIQRANMQNAENVATIVHGGGLGGLDFSAASQATVEGSLLALYRYEAQKATREDRKDIQSLTIVEFDENKIESVQTSVRTGEAISRGVYLARDLVNMPPNIATPTWMAGMAGKIANDHEMVLTVGDRNWAEQGKMGAYLSVAKGAGEDPKFIVLEHNRDRDDQDTVVLIGKGITFDTGGISLKPSGNMGNMKADMAGAAAVLGVMKVAGLLDLPLHIIGIAPCTENMPDAHAYHPADVITASNDKTIEIVSTDAEGRMVLADALVYAQRYKPNAVVDLATLTSSCVVALGKNVAAGLFSNDDRLSERLVASGKNTHERVWPMPLWDDYRRLIDSDVADMKNSGGRTNGVGTSAVFLQEFTDYPWAHLDIAGMALVDKKNENSYVSKGGTGFGVRLLVDLLLNW